MQLKHPVKVSWVNLTFHGIWNAQQQCCHISVLVQNILFSFHRCAVSVSQPTFRIQTKCTFTLVWCVNMFNILVSHISGSRSLSHLPVLKTLRWSWPVCGSRPVTLSPLPAVPLVGTVEGALPLHSTLRGGRKELFIISYFTDRPVKTPEHLPKNLKVCHRLHSFVKSRRALSKERTHSSCSRRWEQSQPGCGGNCPGEKLSSADSGCGLWSFSPHEDQCTTGPPEADTPVTADTVHMNTTATTGESNKHLLAQDHNLEITWEITNKYFFLSCSSLCSDLPKYLEISKKHLSLHLILFTGLCKLLRDKSHL